MDSADPAAVKTAASAASGEMPLAFRTLGFALASNSSCTSSALPLLVAEVLVGLATDTTVYSSQWGEALQVNKLTFTIRASDSSWRPGLPGRPLFPAFLSYHDTPNHTRICQMLIYRGNSLTSKRTPLGPYHRPMLRVLGGS